MKIINVKLYVKNLHIVQTYIVCGLTSLTLILFALPVSTYAAQKQLTRNQLKALGVYYLDTIVERPSTVSGPVAGSGSCYELAMPQINDLAVLAKAIDDHIKSKRPASPFVGLGADIVQGAVRNGVNPMFVVGNLRMESAYGTTGTGGAADTKDLATLLHRNFNAFGRTAGASQPNFASSTGRLWYKYPSWKDSVNSPGSSTTNTTDQPSLMKKVYLDDGLLTIGQYLGRYAPASDGNDESVYGKVLKEVIGSIISNAGSALNCTDNTTVVSAAGGQQAP
ncbi:hypothetical protein EBZ38_13375 [bacterium]|nr:hypothetical protein [bacterium]